MADVKQLKQDLAALETATGELLESLNFAYQKYFATLAQSLRRQVVSTCYTLCTQGYPERFLDLSFDHREQLQQAIQKAIADHSEGLESPQALLQATEERRREVEQAARDAADAVLEALEAAAEESGGSLETIVVQPAPSPADLDLGLTLAAAQQADAAAEDLTGQAEPDAAEPDTADDAEADNAKADNAGASTGSSTKPGLDQTAADGADGDPTAAQFAEQDPNEVAPSPSATAPPAEPVTPLTLLEQWERIDTALTYLVEELTDDINGLLRETKIIPQEMPEAVLEAILKAGSAEVVDAPPNVLSLVIHTEEYEGNGPIMAVRLRISELEFNDTVLSAARSQLRESHSTLKKLCRRYEIYRHERLKVDAESAWRAAWHDRP